MRGRFALVLLAVCLLGPSAVGADPDLERPSWLFGAWAYENAEGMGEFEFRTDGTCRFTAKPKGADAKVMDARWRVEGDQLVVESQGEAPRARLERLPDAAGRPRLRIHFEGGEAEAQALTQVRTPDPNEWLIGTWIHTGPERGRLVIQPGSELRVVAFEKGQRAALETEWAVEDGHLVFLLGGEVVHLKISLLADVEGVSRARLDEARGPAGSGLFHKHPLRDASVRYQGPLVGRWRLVGGPLTTTYVFLATGRYERRREFAFRPIDVQVGGFAVVRTALGETLQLSPDGGGLAERSLRLSTPSSLRLADLTLGWVETLEKQEGSDAEVTREARRVDARYGDAVASREEDLATRPLDPAAWDVAPPVAKDSGDDDADPKPNDVFRGELVFTSQASWVLLSEEVLLEDKAGGRYFDLRTTDAALKSRGAPAIPRQETLVHAYPHGRLFIDVLEARVGDLAGVTVPHPRRWGKYSVTGAMILAQFDDGTEERLRLVDGGLLLQRGEALLSSTAWSDALSTDAK